MESLIKLIKRPCFGVEVPDQSDMDTAAASFNKLMRGVSPIGNFWMMTKLSDDMDNHEKMAAPSKDEILKAILSVKRFRLNERVYRSNDIIAGIDGMLRGPDLNRNYYREIQLIFHMTKGDLFLDYMQIANQKIRSAKSKENQ